MDKEVKLEKPLLRVLLLFICILPNRGFCTVILPTFLSPTAEHAEPNLW